MKVAFLALLLLNIAVFAWYLAASPDATTTQDDTVVVSPDNTLASITLLADQAPAQSATPAPASTAAPVKPVQPNAPASSTPKPELPVASKPASHATPKPVCVRYGAFKTRAQARALLSRLDASAAAFRIQISSHNVVSTYRVYFAAEKTTAKARALENRLKKAGVKDVYVILKGKHKNTVSVGVFSSHHGAVSRRKHIQELGFKPQIEPNDTHQVNHYWLQTKHPAAARALKAYAGQKHAGMALKSCGALQPDA